MADVAQSVILNEIAVVEAVEETVEASASPTTEASASPPQKSIRRFQDIVNKKLSAAKYVEDDENKKNRKKLALQSYSEDKTFIPTTPTQNYRGVEMERTPLFPPTYFFFSCITLILFSLPIGIYAVYYSKRAQRAIERLDLKKARSNSNEAHRYISLGLTYGSIFYLVALTIISSSFQLQQHLLMYAYNYQHNLNNNV